MFQVTPLLDGFFEIPAETFLYVGDEAEGARIRAEKAGAATPVPVNCFLLRGGEELTLIDVGTGTAWGPGLGHARAALAAEGVRPDAIERLPLTHVHGDHALGLFEGEAAYFPQARISVPAADLAYLTNPAARVAAPAAQRSVFDIADRLLHLYAGRVDTFTGNEVREGIIALPLPGHTPGHTGYRFDTAEGEVLLWGDVLHLQDIQPASPRTGLIYDTDSELAFRSRLLVLDLAAREGIRVGGGHVPGFFRVVPDGEGFRLV
jgi:glyoxylase-like metal-dependent hydrolase (beta-lactamase superfamily II)